MVVVIMLVGAVTTLAAPSVMQLVKNERQAERVRAIAAVISNARSLAMGRGSSVLVRYPDANGNIEVREAVRGLEAAGCTNVAAVGCSWPGRWDSIALSQPIERLSVSGIDPAMTVEGPDGVVGAVSLCFTPQGRTWASLGPNPLRPLTSEVSFVAENDYFIERRVVVLPTGATRLIVTNTNP